MKFLLASADKSHRVRFRINGEEGDCTSFLNWVNVWEGWHLSFDEMRKEDISYLKEFDVLMMSGHPGYIQDIIKIAEYLKDSKTITMFYPEGSTQLYENSIRNFHKEYFEAWNACDILSIVEEDKEPYYKSFITSDAIVKFIHVPLHPRMWNGEFLIPRGMKSNYTLIYGDNNPNHPLVAFACAEKIKLDVMALEIGKENCAEIAKIFPGINIIDKTKLGQFPFLRHLSRSLIHFYPSEWIGTARQQIACAMVGTPCIGNKDSHTQKRLFPNLGCEIHDIDLMVDLAVRLMKDDNLYNQTTKEAFLEAFYFYGMEQTKKRFVDAVEEAKKIKEKVMVPV